MILPLEQDRLAQHLLKLGIPVKDRTLTKSPYDRNVVARFFKRDLVQITYNYFENNPTILVLALYEIDEHKTGLGNPFTEGLWVVDLCAKEDLGIDRIECTTKTIPTDLPNGLKPQQIGKFCQKYVGAKIGTRNFLPYYYLDLKDYTGILKKGRVHI